MIKQLLQEADGNFAALEAYTLADLIRLEGESQEADDLETYASIETDLFYEKFSRYHKI